MAYISVKKEYIELTERMMTNVPLDLSAKSDIDGMSQILIAILLPLNGNKGAITEVLKSESCLVSIIQEACRRGARQRFRLKSGGDKEKSRDIATDYTTTLMGVKATSAPYTLTGMEADLPTKNVRLDCDDSFCLDSQLAKQEIKWVLNIAKQWCRIWSFARGLCNIVTSREGGWNKIERDMEIGTSSYDDVIGSLKKVKLEKPRQMFGKIGRAHV